ncbi:MAG: hypothetical protein AB1439_05915 [candidate division FCPU426 bacterium]
METMEMKAAGIVFMRELFKQSAAGQEEEFLSQLNPEETMQYKNCLPVSWMPIYNYVRILKRGAQILFPGDPAPLQRLSAAEAEYDLQGVYRVLLKVISIPALVNQTAKLWDKYYKRGVARTEADYASKRATLFVEKYPELPAESRETVTGYLKGALNLTGVKNVQITPDDADPNQWKWLITWD